MAKLNSGIETLDKYIKNGSYDDFALLTHYIQLQGQPEAEKYKKVLSDKGIDINQLPSKEEFNSYNETPFPNKEKKFTFIDLFAGIGGFRLAMQNCGGECVFSSEWDKYAAQTYYTNYGEVPFGDITKKEIKDMIPDSFDVLCAGFPCQPFSNAGLKKGIEDTRGTLFYEIAEILRDHQPKAVFLENVRGLISNDHGNTFRTIIRTITEMGYCCNITSDLIESGSLTQIQTEASKMVLHAKDYGIPQNRPRIYIVLWRKDLNINHFDYPKKSNENTSVGYILESEVSDSFTLSDKLWEGHKRRKIEHEAKGNGFGYCLFNNTSPYTSTLSRRYYKDGSEILIEQEGKNPRKLTPREAASLQGYPKEFKIHPSKVEAYKQFGNSIAVPVVERVSKQIAKQILGVAK